MGKCECKSGFGNCNDNWGDGCEANFSTDPHHCSDCATDCSNITKCVNTNGSNPTCENGVCKLSCYMNFLDCNYEAGKSDGCEIERTSVNSCGGSCDKVVKCSDANGTNPVCENSVCKLTCNSGYLDCNAKEGESDGCEKQLDPKHLWSKRFGGSNDDYGTSISVDSSGNVYGTGYFNSSNADFGGCPLSSAGAKDIFLIKYAP